jgi:hypothetical protein
MVTEGSPAQARHSMGLEPHATIIGVTEPGTPRLKVHRRSIRLDGQYHTVLSPRPGVGCSFATNRFHETWHVLAGGEGVRLLARLCWALAYQRRQSTLALIDPSLLVPNPFDADPSSPIAILNNDLGSLRRSAADDLHGELPFRTAPAGTVTLNTRGLDEALRDMRAFRSSEESSGYSWNVHQQRRWIDQVNGIVVIAAPPPVLRGWGVALSQLATPGVGGTEGDAELLDWPRNEGEVQLIDGFADRVSRAVQARERLFPGRAHQELRDEERRQVWSETGRSV